MDIYYGESVGRYVGHFYRQRQSFLSKEYKELGIGAGQYQFLINLYLKDGLSHDELTEKMSVDKATTTRAIIKLEEAGYVRRVLNEHDKRKYHIYLTEKAISKKDEVLRIAALWENKMVGTLTEDEVITLLSIMRKIAKNNPNYPFSEYEDEVRG